MKKTKVFVAVGTHPQQFDRLIKKVDEIAGKEKGFDFFGQIGHCSYIPKNFSYKRFLGIEEFDKRIFWSDLVVTHAGAGTFSKCNLLGKKLVVVPRLKEFDEHNDDHQKELAETIREKRLGLICLNVEELEQTIKTAKNFEQKKLERGIIIEILNDFFGLKK